MNPIFSFFGSKGAPNEHRKADTRIHRDTNAAAAASGAAVAGAGASAGEGPGTGAGENPSIVLGEITAYRCWDTSNSVYQSINGTLWFPNEPMSGENVTLDGSSGVYAFRTLAEARSNAKGHRSMAVGSVKMWGTIVEHETGYRAQFAKIDKIIDGEIKDYDSSLRARISAEKDRGPQFEEDHRRDKASYRFRCERYGDFLSIFVERGGQKVASAISLIGSGAITPKDGWPVTTGPAQFAIGRYGKETSIWRQSHRPAGMILHVPPPSDKGASGGGHFVGHWDRGVTIPDCAIPAGDDEIQFGSGVIIYAPHGCGREVFQQILDASRESEKRG